MKAQTSLAPVAINGKRLKPKNTVHRKKLEALQVFTNYLLNSPARAQIAKVVLFGSVAKGLAKKDSDVDVLVFGFGDLEALRDQVYDAAQEAWSQKQEGIEPLVDDGYDLLEPTDYFMYQVTRHGKEVYAMPRQRLKREQIRELFDLARNYRVGAEHALAANDLRLAADAAYNSAELCLKGLLHLKMQDIPGSHGGLVDKFGELYCKPKILPRELGRRIHKGLEIRSHARYSPIAEINAEKVKHNLDLAQEMISHLEQALEGTDDE